MSRRRPSRFHGLLPVVKASGPTSHDVVAIARRSLGERRIGHTGTLDPMARGLLLLCVGQATRLQQFLLGWDKIYRGLIKLGHATDTYDAEGEPTEPRGPVPEELTDGQIAELVDLFSGDIEQVPPPFSAKKVKGKKLYELAREGKEPDEEVEAKRVRVDELELESPTPGELRFHLRCTTGFYVRTLAHDLGIKLGCGAHLAEAFERVSIGPYSVDDAVPQETLEAAEDAAEIVEGSSWVGLDDAALPMPQLTLNPSAEERFVHGQEVIVLRVEPGELDARDQVCVKGSRGDLLGIGTISNVLARGRSVAVRPRAVLQIASTGTARA